MSGPVCIKKACFVLFTLLALLLHSVAKGADCDFRRVSISPYWENGRVVVNFTYANDWEGCGQGVVCEARTLQGELLVSERVMLVDSFQPVYLSSEAFSKMGGWIKVRCSFKGINVPDAEERVKLPVSLAAEDAALSEMLPEDGRDDSGEEVSVTAIRNQNGSYGVMGTLNNRKVPCIIDTGATYVTINRRDARKLHIRYDSRRKVKLFTASGEDTAWPATVSTITIGTITLKNIPAVITKGNYPPVVLVGMSFLKHVNMAHDGEVLQLVPK